MIADRRSVGVAFAVLVALTLAALVFTMGSLHDLLSARGAAAGAAVVAFVKARLVAMDFMELRGTALRPWVEVWFTVVALLCLALILR